MSDTEKTKENEEPVPSGMIRTSTGELIDNIQTPFIYERYIHG